MNSLAKTNRSLVLLLLICLFEYSNAQNLQVPKNFPGVFAGIEWNTMSGSWGVDYERLFYTRNKLGLGARIGYVSSYDYGNMEVLGNSCCESASQILLSATGLYFTGRKRDFTGFFLHTALGAGLVQLKYNSQSYTNERNLVRPLFEFGPGLQYYMGRRFVIRGKLSAAFGPFEGSFTSTTISLGF